MEKNKLLKLITTVLAVLVICLVSFVGVYVQNSNRMENKVKGYEHSSDLSGYRELTFDLSDATQVTDSKGQVVGNSDDISESSIQSNSYQKTENKVNSDESKTAENYKKSKKIIEKRLKLLGVQEYNLSLNEENGKIYLQLPENENTDHTISNILQVSDFKITDSEDKSKVYFSNENLKKVAATYNTTTSGTVVYLQIEFNKEGTEKLKELSTGEYVTKPEENTTENDTTDENAVEAEAEVSNSEENKDENTSNDENPEEKKDNQKKIILSIDNNDMITTSFDDPIEDGIITLSMSKATTDSESISNSLQSASTISLLLNSGKMPLTYKVTENQYVKADISKKSIKIILTIIIILAVLVLCYIIAKFKGRGVIASIVYVGFIAVYLLVLRYTNVLISLESIVAIILVAILNYGLSKRLLLINEADKEVRKKAYSKEFKDTILKLIPIFIVSIIFSFIKWTAINTFGMCMFWGIALIVIYNYILTKNVLD